MRHKSRRPAPVPQAPLPAEHPGEGLPLWLHPGQGERHPRLTALLDPAGVAAVEALDDASLGRLVRLGCYLALGIAWEPAIAAVCAAPGSRQNHERALRAILRPGAR